MRAEVADRCVPRGRACTHGIVVVLAVLLGTAACYGPSGAVASGWATFETLPPKASLPSGDECARRVDPSLWEARPQNRTANSTVPPAVDLPEWEGYDDRANELARPRITGDFTGTTDQIIQWSSCKWGIDTDVVRAMALIESNWLQSAEGDYTDDPGKCLPGYTVPCPVSFGILQIKYFYHPGSYPWSQRSTAYNLDYSLAVMRSCYEGWNVGAGDGYEAGDIQGCIAYHWSGRWGDAGGLEYAARVDRCRQLRPWQSWSHAEDGDTVGGADATC